MVMNNPGGVLEMPRRYSLSAQLVETIRRAIATGTWAEYLPSERRLCELFKVSRPTVRTALRVLAHERLIDIRHGSRVRIVSAAAARRSTQNRVVGVVTHEPFSHLASATYHSISAVLGVLAEHGFATEVLVCQRGTGAAQCRRLEAFLRQHRAFCCILLSVSRELQQWFVENGMPALILGSCHASIRLASLDVDHRSVCRHAAGIFLAKGHRRIALVVPNSGIAGYLASETGFREGVANHRGPDEARAIIVRHSGTAQSITTKLNALFNSENPPTALMVAKPQDVFAVIIYLLTRGLSVPDRISLIARDHEHNFEYVSPPIAHYAFKGDTFTNLLSRLILQLAEHGYLAPAPNLIFPKFIAGGTVSGPSDPVRQPRPRARPVRPEPA